MEEAATIRNFRIVQTEGSRQVTRDTKHYNLQMIIAVGFKVNSERAVQFRKWVNQIAKDYTIKGWVMDDERLKRGTYLTEKYFDEQLERIREIRASERKFYQKITDLYATAIDYDKNSATTRRFYATVQNKMHYAVHGHTAAELIVERADHTKEHMGLTTWADAPEGKIKKSDVTVAKNYLYTPISRFNKIQLCEYIIDNGQYATQELLKAAVVYRFAHSNYSGNPDVNSSSCEDIANEEEFRLIGDMVKSIDKDYNWLKKELKMDYNENELSSGIPIL